MRLERIELGRLEYGKKLRSDTDPRKFLELKNSIETKGIISPIMVIVDSKGLRVVDGVLRLEIIREIGWDPKKKIDVLIIDDPETSPLEVTLILNTLREDLSALDEAEIINDLINNYGYKRARVSHILGKSEATIENLLRVFRLPPNILRALRDELVTIAHCRQLTRLKDDPKLLSMIFKKTVEEELTPRDLEILIAYHLSLNQKSEYDFFTPLVIKTKAGSRLRFEPRKRSIRMELNVLSDDLGDVISEMKAQLQKLTQRHLKDVG